MFTKIQLCFKDVIFWQEFFYKEQTPAESCEETNALEEAFLYKEYFMLEACGAYNDVAEEIDVSEANILVTKASKISEGARIVRGP